MKESLLTQIVSFHINPIFAKVSSKYSTKYGASHQHGWQCQIGRILNIKFPVRKGIQSSFQTKLKILPLGEDHHHRLRIFSWMRQCLIDFPFQNYLCRHHHQNKIFL